MATRRGISSNKWLWGMTVVMTALLVSTVSAQLGVEIPNADKWAASGHNNMEAEAFTHWDEDGEIRSSCAKCHSTPGQLDFLGADGTEAGIVDNPAPLGTTVECIACHNDVSVEKTSVVFPSGIEAGDLGPSARCMECHQGRSSGPSVAATIADANLPDDDTVSSLRFQNIHYYAAGATLLAGEVMGGYQYAGKSYDIRLTHVEGISKCADCHDPHSLEIKIDTCAECHAVDDHEDLHSIRYAGSLMDYDGDNDITEGIYGEITTLRAILYDAMRAYAESVGTPITYDEHSYPYFFADENNNDQADEGEDSYNAFTARLLKAAYNYQVALKDPGGFAHNGKYIIQLLYDSIEDLNPEMVAGLTRNDFGHFAGSEEPFRHWDEDGDVSGRCSKCHSADGLPFLFAEGVTVTQPVANGFKCSTCHDAIPEFTRRVSGPVTFPSGAVIDSGDPDTNLCLNCHQGRESGASVAAAVDGLEPDVVMQGQRFINVHYYAAGATRYGTEAWGAYEYPGKEYKGYFKHVSAFNSCQECHDAHTGRIDLHGCLICHKNIEKPQDIRLSKPDYDGDGDTEEGLAGEVETLRETLYTAMQAYASNVVGVPIVYADHYPYFETEDGSRYESFTPRLLQAAHNYQVSLKDPGAFAHNGKYIIQVLYDSLEDLGADTSGLVRP